jgi:hypothetical protein
VAVAVTPNLTIISVCDATTGWTAVGGTNALNDPTVFGHIQGNYCLQNYNASSINRGSDFLWSVDTNLTNQTIYAWFAFNMISILQNKGSTGLRIRVTDVSANWSEWDIAGKDTLPHAGWICWAVRTNQTPSRSSATPAVMTTIRKVGWRADSVAAKGYVYFDAFRYGTGLTITGGDAGTPANFEAFYTADNDSANKYGVITKIEGVYMVQGVLNIGSASQTATTYFKSTGKALVFKDVMVGTGFYEVKAVGAASYATTVYIGEKSGTAGINGNVFSCSGTQKYKITLSDQYVTVFGVYGCTFLGADTITFPAYSANKEVLNTNFSACAEVIPSTTTITNCNFISAAANALQMSSESHKITYCNFISCSRGIDITAGSTFTFTGLKFTSCTYDVKNATGGSIVINCTAGSGSNPSTVENDSSSIVNSATFKITGLIDNTEVRVYNHGTITELTGIENSSGGTFTWDYNPSTYSHIDIQIVSINYLDIHYENVPIGSDGLTIPIQQQLDRQYANPA